MKTNVASDLKKCLPYLLQAKEDNLNEADTSQRVIKVLENVLGYNALTDIACEVAVRSKYVDLTVKIEAVAKFYVEVKSATTELSDRHVLQGEIYGAKGNIHWVLLTNGLDWNLYHLTFDEGLEHELVFSVTLSQSTLASAADALSLLHKASVKAGRHEDFLASSAESVGKFPGFWEPA